MTCLALSSLVLTQVMQSKSDYTMAAPVNCFASHHLISHACCTIVLPLLVEIPVLRLGMYDFSRSIFMEQFI